MFEFMDGILSHIHPTYVVLVNQGIGYKIQVANPYAYSDQLSQEVRLYLEQIFRERDGTVDLYGFKDLEEKQLFLTLNKVSGIGPKSAMSILALGDHGGLVSAIEQGDFEYLTKFPGVGKKTAQQMILDLQGRLDFVSGIETGPAAATTGQESLLEEVYAALAGLGYSQREIKRIEKAMEAQTFADTQAALSHAFTLLINK